MTRKGGSFLVVLFLCIAIARAETPEWFRRARVCGHWIWAAEYEDKLYSDEELKKQVADAAKAGYNVVCTGLPLRRGILGIADPDIIRQMRVVADECHHRGMHAIFHYVTLNVKELTDRYKGSTQIDAETGQPVDFSMNREGKKEHYFWALCPNNPVIRKAHTETLARFFRETGMDGFFTDLFWRAPYACVCPYCREKVKAQAGIELPQTFDKSFYGNLENKDYHAWWTWRSKTLGDFLREVQASLKKVRSVIIVGHYETYLPREWRSLATLSLEDCEGLDYTAVEIGRPFTHYYNWQYNATAAKYCVSIADARGQVAWTLPHVASLSEDFFLWSLDEALHSRYWFFKQGTAPAGRLATVKREFASWEDANWEWLNSAAPYRDAALYFSLATRDFASDPAVDRPQRHRPYHRGSAEDSDAFQRPVEGLARV